ncbi:hypothetical protein MTO96_009698 [Rhipicephalus appendiculatus]
MQGKTVVAEASSPTLHNTGHLCVVKFWFNYRAPNDTHQFLMELHVNGFQIVAWDSWELAENPQGEWNEGQFLLGRYRSPVQILLRGYDSPSDDSYTAIDDISFQSCGMPGSFLFLKSKAKAVVASLRGPQLNATTLCVMRFYYTIRGPTNAVLSVKTRITADGEFKEVWKSDRPTAFSHFTEAFVPFHEDSDFEVSIEGSIEGGRNAPGYMAIDDVTFLDSCHAASGQLPKSSTETTTAAPSNCSRNEFSCLSVAHCIPANQLCDFLKHCPDGSDESHCGACDFSVDMCGLEAARAQSQPRWTRLSTVLVSNNQARFPSLPREDSSHNERGFYAAFLRTDTEFSAHLSVDVVETLRDKDKTWITKRRVLRVWDDTEEVTWKMQAVNVGNRRPGARFYFSAAENASIDDIEYHHCHPEDTTEECNFARLNGPSGRLVSAQHDLSLVERRCFRFWHFFTGQREMTLSVYKHVAAPEESRELVWTINGEDRLPRQWLSGSVNIAVNETSSMRLELEGKNLSGNESALAVDDLLLSRLGVPETWQLHLRGRPL